MNVEKMSNEEAKDFLSKHTAEEILRLHTPPEIEIIVKKAGNHIVRRIPAKTIEVNSITNPQPKSPSIPQMARSFGKAMVESAKTGFKQVSNEVYNQRLAICKLCEHWSTSPVGHCKICNCTTAKHRLATSRCPLNPPKWNKLL